MNDGSRVTEEAHQRQAEFRADANAQTMATIEHNIRAIIRTEQVPGQAGWVDKLYRLRRETCWWRP